MLTTVKDDKRRRLIQLQIQKATPLARCSCISRSRSAFFSTKLTFYGGLKASLFSSMRRSSPSSKSGGAYR